MNFNSDGYIMIDFSKVNFSKTNQTIDGLYDRCRSVIGTNKFVLVINANKKTPLPSTVSKTNNKYVIESVLFTFEISSNDNIHITKKTTADELIDDSHSSTSTTFSSNKILSELEKKENAAYIEIKTLNAGSTSIEFIDDCINGDSWVFPFTSIYGISPINMTINNHTLTLTFKAQENDLYVGVRVY